MSHGNFPLQRLISKVNFLVLGNYHEKINQQISVNSLRLQMRYPKATHWMKKSTTMREPHSNYNVKNNESV